MEAATPRTTATLTEEKTMQAAAAAGGSHSPSEWVEAPPRARHQYKVVACLGEVQNGFVCMSGQI